MKWIVAIVFVATVTIGVSARADTATRDLAQVTGTNIGFVAGKLAEHQQGINDISSKRIELIASVERLRAEARMKIDREVSVLNLTGGTNLVKLLDALRASADSAAAAPALLDTLQAKVRADLLAVYKPLAISTDKLNESAKTLATLGKPKSDAERVTFLISYLKEVREDAKKLEKESEVKKKEGDAAVAGKADEENKKVAEAAKKANNSNNTNNTNKTNNGTTTATSR